LQPHRGCTGSLRSAKRWGTCSQRPLRGSGIS